MIMKHSLLAGLAVLTLAVASPAHAFSSRSGDHTQLYNDVTGAHAFAPALTTETHLTGRFKAARDANYDS
jgi:hypothetical protein